MTLLNSLRVFCVLVIFHAIALYFDIGMGYRAAILIAAFVALGSNASIAYMLNAISDAHGKICQLIICLIVCLYVFMTQHFAFVRVSAYVSASAFFVVLGYLMVNKKAKYYLSDYDDVDFE